MLLDTWSVEKLRVQCLRWQVLHMSAGDKFCKAVLVNALLQHPDAAELVNYAPLDEDGLCAFGGEQQSVLTLNPVVSLVPPVPETLVPRRVKRCEHGTPKVHCKICSDCGHGTLRCNCRICNGCGHHRVISKCKICSGCVHNKVQDSCKICSDCGHNSIKRKCKICSDCGHNNIKSQCKVCSDCGHNTIKYSCRICSNCGHGAVKRGCEICNGCLHGELKGSCIVCRVARAAERATRDALLMCDI